MDVTLGPNSVKSAHRQLEFARFPVSGNAVSQALSRVRSRISVTGVTRVDNLDWVIEFLGMNQSGTYCPFEFSVRARVSSDFHSRTPGAATITYLVVTPSCSEPEFHFGKLTAGETRGCDARHT